MLWKILIMSSREPFFRFLVLDGERQELLCAQLMTQLLRCLHRLYRVGDEVVWFFQHSAPCGRIYGFDCWVASGNFCQLKRTLD